MPEKSVLFVVEAMGYGGTPRNVLNLANRMVKDGHKAAIAILGGDDTLCSQLDSRVKLHRLGKPLLLLPLWWHLMRNRDYDLIVPGLHLVNLVTIMAHSNARHRAKLAISLHTPIAPRLRNQSSALFDALLKACRASYPLADAVIAVSQGIKDDTVAQLGVPPERITVIHNPVVNALPDAANYASPYAPDKTNLLACAVFKPQKNLCFMIEAMAQLVSIRPDCHLTLVGDGDEKPAIEAAIAKHELHNHVTLAGFFPDPTAWFVHADRFLLTSQYEGLGNVLIEALAAGVPIVAIDCPSGPAEVLCGGEFGVLVPQDASAQGFAQAIDQSLASPARERAFYQRRALDFNTATIAKAYLAFAR